MSNHLNFNNSIKSSLIKSTRQVAKLISSSREALSWIHADREDFIKRVLTGTITGRVFNLLVGRFNKYPIVFLKIDTIAKELGIHRVSVSRAIATLKKYGLINVIYRNNHPSLYGLPGYFRDKGIRSQLKKHFQAFACLTLALLLSSADSLSYQKQNKILMEYVIQTKEVKFVYKKYSLLLRNDIRMSKSRNFYRRFAGGDLEAVQKPTGELRPIAFQSEYESKQDKMHRRRDEDLKALLDQGLITREQAEQILRSRR